MSNKYLAVESLYLYANHVFGYANWSHEITKYAYSLASSYI